MPTHTIRIPYAVHAIAQLARAPGLSLSNADYLAEAACDSLQTFADYLAEADAAARAYIDAHATFPPGSRRFDDHLRFIREEAAARDAIYLLAIGAYAPAELGLPELAVELAPPDEEAPRPPEEGAEAPWDTPRGRRDDRRAELLGYNGREFCRNFLRRAGDVLNAEDVLKYGDVKVTAEWCDGRDALYIHALGGQYVVFMFGMDPK